MLDNAYGTDVIPPAAIAITDEMLPPEIAAKAKPVANSGILTPLLYPPEQLHVVC